MTQELRDAIVAAADRRSTGIASTRRVVVGELWAAQACEASGR